MHETQAMREKLFTMRVSEEESARLELVAKHYGLNAAGALRMLIKREADAIVANRPKPATSKKRSAKK